MHIQRILLLLFIIVGIYSSLYAPWFVYPNIDGVLYGKMGDGWVFMVLLSISALLVGVVNRKRIMDKWQKWSVVIIWLIILLLTVQKIVDFKSEKSAFDSQDPYMITANAGSYIGWGLYVLVASMGLAVLFVFLFPKFFGNEVFTFLFRTGFCFLMFRLRWRHPKSR